jgi:hypothetical protein
MDERDSSRKPGSLKIPADFIGEMVLRVPDLIISI